MKLLLPFIGLLFVAVRAEAQTSATAPTISPDLVETLRWLPAKTDAILVAQDFELPKTRFPLEGASLGDDPFVMALRLLAIGRGLAHDPLNDALDRVAGRRVDFALHAGREFFGASAFGSCGYSGCHVIRFYQPLADAAAGLSQALRKTASEIAMVDGREIAIFGDWRFPKEGYIEPRAGRRCASCCRRPTIAS